MKTNDRDPIYIAEQVKLIRDILKITQENLANESGLSTRTIEKIESGKHKPNEQSLRSIARATKFNMAVFDKPTPEEALRNKAAFEDEAKKTVLVQTIPVTTPSDFMNKFQQFHAYKIDMSPIQEDNILSLAAEIGDFYADCIDIWDVLSSSQRIEYARIFIDLCEKVKNDGYVCYMGDYKQQLREKNKDPIIFSVGLMTFRKQKDKNLIGYAMVRIDKPWEKLETDGIAI